MQPFFLPNRGMRQLCRSSLLLGGSFALLFGNVAPVPAQAVRTGTVRVEPVHSLSRDNLGRRLTVQGEVASVQPPASEGRPYRVRLKDSTGEANIVIWPEDWEQLRFSPEIKPSSVLQATVDVINNSGTIEGNVAEPAHLAFVQPASWFWRQLTWLKERISQAASAGPGNWLYILTAAAVLATLLFRTRRKLRKVSTERNQALLNHKEDVARLTQLLRASSSVIYTLKPSQAGAGISHLTFISDSLEQMLGYEAKEVYSRPEWWASNLHPEDRTRAIEQQALLFQTDTLERHFRFRHRNGTYLQIRDQQKLLRDSMGQPYEVIGTWFDVTEAAKENQLKLTLATLGEALSAAETPQEVARIVLDAAAELLESECSFVSLYSETDQRMKPVIVYDEEDGKRREMMVDPEGTPITDISSDVLSSGAKLILRTEKERDFQGLNYAGTARRSASLLFAPIRHAGKGIGILSVQSYATDAYREKDKELLQVLADYCGAAMTRTFAEQGRRAMEEALRESEERYALALKGANDGLWDWDLKANRIYFSARCSAMIGLAPSEFSGEPSDWEKVIHPEDLESVRSAISAHLEGSTAQLEVEYRVARPDGVDRWILLRGVAIRSGDGQPYRMAGSQSDITERKAIEEKLEQGAYYDHLTGLPNRLLFMDHLGHAMARYKRHPDKLFAVLFLDLDRFKVINDSLGHFAGDQLLIVTAERLKECVRPEDIVARLGGDEFTVLLENVNDVSDATRIAERIQAQLSTTVLVGEHETYTTASIGIAFSRGEYTRPEEVLRDADSAMYRAKEKGKSRYELFDSEMYARAMQVLSLDSEMRRAVEAREFVVFYQPQFNVSTGLILGFEALVRWHHPTRGLLAPGEFIGQAEENGVITEIGLFVLREACREMEAWRQSIPEAASLTLSVNVSRKQLAVKTFYGDVTEALKATGFPPSLLALEITESTLMENANWLIELLHELKAFEIRLHMDDFGTGYSSLSYLRRFPLDTLKVDRSFVSGIAADSGSLQIVKAVLALADSLNMEVIAEGIETSEQLSLLQSLGCSMGQGYLLGKPLGAEETKQVLLRHLNGATL